MFCLEVPILFFPLSFSVLVTFITVNFFSSRRYNGIILTFKSPVIIGILIIILLCVEGGILYVYYGLSANGLTVFLVVSKRD